MHICLTRGWQFSKFKNLLFFENEWNRVRASLVLRESSSEALPPQRSATRCREKSAAKNAANSTRWRRVTREWFRRQPMPELGTRESTLACYTRQWVVKESGSIINICFLAKSDFSVSFVRKFWLLFEDSFLICGVKWLILSPFALGMF